MRLVSRALFKVCGFMVLTAFGAGVAPRAVSEDGPPSWRLGGATTTDDAGAGAFAHMAANAPEARRRDFALGSRLFAIEWAPYPNAVKIFDGLGPTFNRSSCAGCHQANGRGRPPEQPGDPLDSMLVRVSEASATPGVYGDQINDRAIDGVPPEGQVRIRYDMITGAYGDGTPYTLLRPRIELADLAHGALDGASSFSARVAPAVIGLGLLEAIPPAMLESLADPDDRNGDGISGRINHLGPAGAVGRFGWKANVAGLSHQVAAAAIGDMGLTTSLYPDQNCPPVQTECLAAAAEDGPEIVDSLLARIVTAMRTVAVPAQRDASDAEVVEGFAAFRRFGCAACHVPTLATDGTAALPELRNQTFHPFTDLLLHDMGPGLADGRPDHDASGSEWRTPPLWGLGLVQVVNGHDRLLHDGRARGFAEAILWHGGEAESAREGFRTADRRAREALLAFLGSL